MRYSYHDWFNWPTTWFIRKAKQTFQYTIFVTLIHTREGLRKSENPKSKSHLSLSPMRGPNEKLFKLFTLSDHENAFVKHSFAPRGCSFVSSRLVSFRNRFFLLLLLLLSVCFQFVLQRVTWRTVRERERERERGGRGCAGCAPKSGTKQVQTCEMFPGVPGYLPSRASSQVFLFSTA